MRTRKAEAGFTLIELTIVVLIVAILAAIAMASYGYAMQKTRRAAAQGCLTETAQYMERWYTLHMTYAGATPPACSADVSTYYTMSVASSATAFTWTAAPQGPQAKDKCGTLTLDDKGRKTPATDCW
jgi:type IV pilus assembly protein PilE